MPRKPLIRTAHTPYHVTSRSNNKEWFALPMPEVWKICLEAMELAHDKHPVDVISFVLMNNHYHLMLITPEANLDLFMYEFNKLISLRLRERSGHINKMFGSRYKWCLIRSQKYFKNCYRYVYQNPLRAGIIHKCEDYPYSTAYIKAKGKKFPIPLCDVLGFMDEFKLMWLNESIKEDERSCIQKALRFSTLDVLKNPITRKPL